MTQQKETADTCLMKLAAARGAMGFAIADVTGFTPKVARKCADRLCAKAQLYKMRHGYRTVKYYAKAEWAHTIVPGTQERVMPASVPSVAPRSVAPWKGKQGVPMVIPKGLKIQKGPSFDPDRWRREDVRVSTNTHGQ